jgi:SAM-dependent methyltransferase
MRVDTTGLPADNWHHFLRLRDLRQVFAEMPLDGILRVLELGAGDGVQTTVLRGMFPKVTPVDIAPSGDVEGMIIADAADLPFEDDSFDLIFSSNVLEHVEQLDVAFNEMKRVLAPGGIMIHSMPTGTWKIVQLLLRPIASAMKIVRRLLPGVPSGVGRAQEGSHGALEEVHQKRRSLLQKLVGSVIPAVHGISGNHVFEFFQFRPKWWKRRFDEAGLECVRSSPLFLHSPYDLLPYRFLGVRDLLGRAGFASVDVFWLRERN